MKSILPIISLSLIGFVTNIPLGITGSGNGLFYSLLIIGGLYSLFLLFFKWKRKDEKKQGKIVDLDEHEKGIS